MRVCFPDIAGAEASRMLFRKVANLRLAFTDRAYFAREVLALFNPEELPGRAEEWRSEHHIFAKGACRNLRLYGGRIFHRSFSFIYIVEYGVRGPFSL